MLSHFSGRIVKTRHEQMITPVQTAPCRVEVFTDAVAGDVPGTIWWSESSHGPVPHGYQVIDEDHAWNEVLISRKRYAPSLRIVVWLRRVSEWMRAGHDLARQWWRARPRFRRC